MYQKSESAGLGYRRDARRVQPIPPAIRSLESLRDPVIPAATLAQDEIARRIHDGYRLVSYPYSLSFLIITLNRTSPSYLLDAGRSGMHLRIGYALVSFLFGWWALPLGPVFTLASIIKSLSGGTDESARFLSSPTSSMGLHSGSLPPAIPVAPASRSAHAVLCLILSIVSLSGIGLLAAIPAVVIGHIDLSRIRTKNRISGRGMALTGLILGYLSIALNILLIVLVARS